MTIRTTRQGSALVLHPFLFSLFPVLSLYARNAGQLAFSETLRALLATLLAAGALFLLLGLAVRDVHRAGLAVMAVVVLFFSFGHVYAWLHATFINALWVRADLLMALWGVGLIILPWASLRILPRGAARGLTPILNVVSASALVLALVPLAPFITRGAGAAKIPAQPAVGASAEAAAPTVGYSPDIYYIILDGFARSDVLEEIYGVDASGMERELEDLGFFIARNSRANYMKTNLSVTSSLNYDYLPNLAQFNPASGDGAALRKLLENNAAAAFLRSRGYEFVVIPSGYRDLEITSADRLEYSSGQDTISAFEVTLLNGSMAVFYVDQAMPDIHRGRILAALDSAAAEAGKPGPRFVFAHIMLPHPPFLFDRSGGPVRQDLTGGAPSAAILDGNHFEGGRDAYLSGYREQALFAQQKVIELVREILAHSAEPPVIILQADHGGGAYLDWYSLENTCLRERFSIFNAYYLPGVEATGLTPETTPVNTFRIVFNAYFDARLELLENQSYFTTFDHPYRFMPVSERQMEAPCTGR